MSKKLNLNIKKKIERGLSVSCAGILMLSMFGQVAFAAEGIVKEENVYVITKSNGAVSETIVSDHLINNAKLDKIADKTTLRDIENVAGEETFEQGVNNSIIWNAKGSDIYYQGNSTKEIPITMDVKYELDGKSISGEDLQGKSGKVKISINYKNNAYVQTGGKSVNVPFVVMTGFLAEGDSLENISVSNGKVINDGDKKMVVCMATPGLANSLGVSVSSSLLNDSVTITADANAFDVKDMMTMVSAGFMDDINSNGFSELDMDDQIKELEKASKKLIDGTDSLYDGIHMLSEKSTALKSGVSDLNEGAMQLNEGIKQSNAGSIALTDGATQLSLALDANLSKIKVGADSLNDGSRSLASGLGTLRDKIDGENGLLSSSQALAGATAELSDSMNTAIDSSRDYLNDALTLLDEMKNEGKISDKEYEKLAQSIGASSIIQDKLKTNVDGVSKGAAAIAEGVGQVSTALNGDGTAANPGLVNGAYQVSSGAKSIADGMSAATADSNSLTSNAKKIADGASSLSEGQAQLSSGASKLAAGMKQLSDSSELLIGGIGQLDMGAKNLKNGMEQYYNDGIKKIIDLYNDDIAGLSASIEQTINAGKAYRTFTSLNDGMSGSVKFIYKTEIA